MSSVFAAPTAPFTVVSAAAIADLVRAARQAPLRRARICLHGSVDDPLHEMIIAFAHDSYVAPHRHRGKSESFHLLAGTVDVVFFTDAGTVADRVTLSADAPERPRIYRLQQPLWHTLAIRSETAVLHEVTNGPFRPEETEVAPWAPSPDDRPAVDRFLTSIRR